MQVVNNSDAFQTPNSGVGSVIFDYPKEQPLDMLLQANADLDKFALRRQAVKAANAKTTDDLLKGLKLTQDGIMLQHVPYFKEKGQGIYESAAKVMAKYNGDLSTPQAQREWMEQVQMPSQQFEVEVKGSQNLGNTLEKVRTELNTKPEDWEQDKSHTNIALLRTTPPNQLFANAENINPDNLLVKRNKGYQSLVVEKLKALPRKATSVPDAKGNLFSVQTNNGKDVMVQQTETIPINDAVELMRGFDTDTDMMDAANADWGKVKGTPAEAYYTDLAVKYQQQGLPIKDAFDAFRLKGIEINNQKDQQLSSLGENMYAKKALSDQEELESARGLYKQAVGMFAGDPQYLQPDYYESERTKQGEDKTKIFETGIKGLDGKPMGKFVTVDANGKPEEEFPNVVEKAVRLKDGTVGLITTQSKYLYSQGAIPHPIVIYKTPHSLLNALISGAPSEGKDLTKTDKLLGNIDKVESEFRTKYGTSWEAQAGLNANQIAEREKINNTQWSPNAPKVIPPTVTEQQKPVVQPKATSKQLTKKLSSGRVVYSDDNGKTWHP